MKMEFAVAICAALLMGAGQIAKHAQGEPSTPAIETHVSPKRTHLSATAGLAKQDPSTRLRILKSYSNLPLTFEENRGQIDPQVKFLSRSAGYTLFLTADGAVLSVPESKRNDKRPRTNPGNDVEEPPIVDRRLPGSESEQRATNPHLVTKLVGANPHATVSGVNELPGKSNFFIGNDPKKWRRNVPTYAKVKYEEVYSGIDLVYYGNQQQLEFDFVVAPGADPRRIRFDVRGTKRIRRDENGDLVLKMEMGEDEIRWHKPIAYQEKNGTRQLVATHYAVRDKNRVSFEMAGYDTHRPLYIDPLIYSTYLGGNGEDRGTGIAVDGAGNAYVTGATSSSNFPTMNPLQPAFEGVGYDAFVAKINPMGSGLVYSTYFGGSGLDVAQGIAVDSEGNAYVTGITQSTDFPTMNPVQPAYGGGDQDAFVAKINPTGSALVYSTYLGGDENDLGYAIAVDSARNAYVTGATSSTNFPTMNPLQPAYGGGDDDAFVTKINESGSALAYSTYLGGSGSDVAQGIAVDRAFNAYVTGGTSSTGFPTMNPVQPAYGGGDDDAFVTKINPAGSALIYSTFLGGSGSDESQGVAVDRAGNAYVTGSTSSNNFPTTNPLQAAFGGEDDAFVTKIDPTGSPLIYSTYLGGNGSDVAQGVAVDSAGNAYVTGSTNSTNFPTVNPLQSAIGGSGQNAFVTELNPTGSALAYSTYFGGSGNAGDGGTGIAVDTAGNAYVTGATSSANFPRMNPLQPAFGGGDGDAFVAKFGAASTGTDFSLSTATGNNCPAEGNCSTSATVNAGQTATYNLEVSPVNGFNGTVGLSCDDALAKSMCSLSLSSVTVSGATASAFTVSVSTSAGSIVGPQTEQPNMRPLARIVFPLLAVLMIALLLATSTAEAKRSERRFVVALALLVFCLAWLGACGSSGGNGGGGNNGTPSGTVTINGNSNGVNRPLSLTLNVDQ
jgi:Beta-propeller repeat